MANNNDVSNAEKLGGIIEWKHQAQEELDDHSTRISSLEQWHEQFTLNKKSVRVGIFVGLLFAIFVLSIALLVVNPSAIKENLPLLIESIKLVFTAFR